MIGRRIKNNSEQSRAFTLVELLVVVSIIALLIAILLPSLKKARDQAKEVVCKANMHSIGQAFTMYAEKYDGVWPAVVDTLNTQNRWPVPFFDGEIIQNDFEVYDSNGSRVSGGGETVFLCPAERAKRQIPDWRIPGNYVDRVTIGGSYAINEEIHRNGDSIDRGKVNPPPEDPFMRKIDNCRRPGAIVELADNFKPIEYVEDLGWRFNRDDFFAGYRTRTGEPLTEVRFERFRRFGGRHGGRCSLLMMDTHVESGKPDRISYNQVSWTTWNGELDDIPGGL